MKNKKQKVSWKVWAGVIAAVILIGIGGNMNKEEEAQEPTRAVATEEPAATAEPTPTPIPTPTPEPTPTPYRIHGLAPDTTVYVSRNNVIHFRSDCSGMKKYTEMTLEEADRAGYSYCEHCG